MIYFVDILGAARYKSTALRYHPLNIGAGIFAEVDGFGPAYDLIERFAAKGIVALKVPLMWSDTHSFDSNSFKVMAARAVKINAIAAKHPDVKFFVGGGWEHKLNTAKAREMAAKIKVKLTSRNCTYVNCPMKGGAILNEELNEFHWDSHKTPPRGVPRFMFSFDGWDCSGMNIEKIKKDWADAEGFAFWIPQDNGKYNDGHTHDPAKADKTPRALRKAWPKGETIRAQAAWAATKLETNFSTKFIHKPLAEQTEKDTANDTRACRPVEIIPQKADFLEYVAANGKVVATAKRYKDPFSDGRWRYYCGKWGYQIGALAFKEAGTRLVSVRVNRKIIGTIDPAFRDGSFR